MPILIISLILLLWGHSAIAAKQCRTESSCFSPKVTWNYTRDGQLKDICHNYATGDWRYRACRTEAGKQIKEKCRELQQQERQTQGQRRERARQQQRTYCIAYRP